MSRVLQVRQVRLRYGLPYLGRAALGPPENYASPTSMSLLTSSASTVQPSLQLDSIDMHRVNNPTINQKCVAVVVGESRRRGTVTYSIE